MTVADVARRLYVSESFVYEIIAKKRLKHHRLGKGQGGIRVTESQLTDFLRQAEHGGEWATDTKPVATPNIPRRTFSFLPPPS